MKANENAKIMWFFGGGNQTMDPPAQAAFLVNECGYSDDVAFWIVYGE